jgi:hypothetical protein
MTLIILVIVFYIIQVGVAICFLMQGEFSSKREFNLTLIPYPYWIVIGIKWLIKFAISQYKGLK